MRIGIDFDNTLADFGELLRRITIERTGVDLRALRDAHPDADDIEAIVHAAIGKQRFEALILEVLATDHSEAMEERPGALEAVRRLGAQHELVIVTARAPKEAETPRRWLRRHGIAVSEFITTDYGPKAPHAIEQGLAVHLDDSAEVFAAFDEAHPTIPALIAHPMNAKATRAAHWRSVEDWRAFEALVQALERELGSR